MVEVNLLYNAYQNSMKILADGQPLNNISSLTRYQTMPFLAWCGEILPKIAEEVNDEYSLIYTGRSCESRVFAALSAKHSVCRSFRPKEPTLSDSTTKRLRRLHQLCVSGLAYTQFTETLNVYSDIDRDELAQMFKDVIPKVCFCRVRIMYRNLDELAENGQESLRFIIAQEKNEEFISNAARALNGETYVLLLSEVNEFVGVQGSCVTEKAMAEALRNVLGQYLELSFYMQLLCKALTMVTADPKDVNYKQLISLDKIEPQTFAELPSSVELNQKLPIKLYTIPEGYEPKQIIYRVSNDEIVHIKNDTLLCTGTGEVIVEVYEAGQSVCIARSRIVAHKRNRITSIRIGQKNLKMCVGDTVRLTASYEPEDADNTNSIAFRSDDGLVASAINGVLTARRPGFTRVSVTTDNGLSDKCEVEVFPKLEKIEMSMSETSLPHNGVANVTVKRVPEDATLDDLVFSVEPAGIAVFDRAGMKLAGRGSGQGRLIVTDKRRSVREEVAFEIKAEKKNYMPTVFKVIGGVLLVAGVIYLLLR